MSIMSRLSEWLDNVRDWWAISREEGEPTRNVLHRFHVVDDDVPKQAVNPSRFRIYVCKSNESQLVAWARRQIAASKQDAAAPPPLVHGAELRHIVEVWKSRSSFEPGHHPLGGIPHVPHLNFDGETYYLLGTGYPGDMLYVKPSGRVVTMSRSAFRRIYTPVEDALPKGKRVIHPRYGMLDGT